MTTRYKVYAEVSYYVDADDEDAVFEHADEVWIDAEGAELYVRHVVALRTPGGAA